jgi:hypothetical protein
LILKRNARASQRSAMFHVFLYPKLAVALGVVLRASHMTSSGLS